MLLKAIGLVPCRMGAKCTSLARRQSMHSCSRPRVSKCDLTIERGALGFKWTCIVDAGFCVDEFD